MHTHTHTHTQTPFAGSFRRHGHNELDDPFFTQPEMYGAVTKHAPVPALYAARLVAAGVTTPAAVEAEEAKVWAAFDAAMAAAATTGRRRAQTRRR